MLIKNSTFVITQNKSREILEGVDVRIQQGKIIEIGKNLSAKGEEILSGEDKILLPGLINAHTHLGMGGLRGLFDDHELEQWLYQIKERENHFSEQDVVDSVARGCKEAIRFGTTALLDSYRLFPEKVIPILKKSGLRLFYSASKSNAKIVDLLKNTQITPVLSAHSVHTHQEYSEDESFLKEVQALSQKHHLLKMMHIGETRLERYQVLKATGKLPIEYLDSIGFLDERMLLVHSIWITKGEIQLIAKQNAKVIHCPISNMKMASGGVMPLLEMWEAGVTVGLGTDSVVSNNNLDLFEEMKVCALLHKQHRWMSAAVTAQKVLDMATVENAVCLGVEKEVGSVEVGKEADLILLSLGLHLQPCTRENVVSNLVYAAQGSDVNDVLIRGEVVLKDRQFVG